MTKEINYKALEALFFSGKVKPTLNKVLAALKNTPEDLDLNLLACQCLVRTKDYKSLLQHADNCLKINTDFAEGYYYKGVALHHAKGKEQEALKNFTEALAREPENTKYIKSKAETHYLLFKDYHLPLKFAEKHRVKAESGLLEVISIIEKKEGATYEELLNVADVCILVSKNIDAKQYYIKAVNAYENAAEDVQNKNIYKDIIKAQKACIKLLEKFTE